MSKIKNIKIDIPEGYEIDEKKSTFENIIFKKKKKDDVVKWNDKYNGVEICADDEHFVVDADPSYCMNFNDAVDFERKNDWKLPTPKQLKVLTKYLDKANKIIYENNGYEIFGSIWSCKEKDETCAWLISDNGNIFNDYKYRYHCVRGVYVLEKD